MERIDRENPARIDDLDGGGTRRVLGYTDELMLVHYSLEAGDEGALHAHDETTQASFVIDGRIELRGDYGGTYETGDGYIVPPGVEHGVLATEPSTVLDAFTPPISAYTTE